MSFEFWFILTATVFAVSIIPGPSMIIALYDGVRFGWKRAIVTASGNALASCLQALVSVMGLGIIIAQSGALFLVIKYIGALYLLYLGLSLWRSPAQHLANASTDDATQQKSSKRLFFNGFIIAAGNPKAVIFFTALFPQFIEIGGSGIVQAAGMVAVVGIVAFSCAMIYAIGGAYLRDTMLVPARLKLFNKVTGGMFIGGGVSLIVMDR